MNRKNRSLGFVLTVLCVMSFMMAWPQVACSQKGGILVGVGANIIKGFNRPYPIPPGPKVSPVPRVPKPVPVIGGGDVRFKYQGPRIEDYSFPEIHSEVEDYIRGVDALIAGDTLKCKKLLKGTLKNFNPLAKYLYAMILLREGEKHYGEATELLGMSYCAPACSFLSLCYEDGVYGLPKSPRLQRHYLDLSVKFGSFDGYVLSAQKAWTRADTLTAINYMQRAYDCQQHIDSVLASPGKKRSLEYYDLYVEWNFSFTKHDIQALYDMLLWLKANHAVSKEEHQRCLEMAAWLDSKYHSAYANIVLAAYHSGLEELLPCDDAKAVEYLKVAADGEREGKKILADHYMLGRGCERDSVKAIALYETAADEGSVDAIDMLTRLNFDARNWEGVQKWGAYCELSDSMEIQYLVGYSYFVEGKYSEAADYLVRPANSGNVDAMWLAYAAISHVNPDAPEGFVYLQKVADTGFADALNDLAVCYQNGSNVAKDIPKALALYEKAREAGSAEACTNLGNLYYNREKVNGKRLNRRLAATYWRDGVEKGDPLSMYNYAACLMEGRCGLKKNKAEGEALMRKAADLDNEEAKAFFARQ